MKDDTVKKVSFNLPSKTWPNAIKSSTLTPTEQKIYLKLSLEYHVILNESPTFQTAAFNWSQILPSRLKKYNITRAEWERISTLGDKNTALQKQLAELTEKLETTKIDT